MFSSSFKFRKINCQNRIINSVSFIEHNYCFKGNNKRYIVIAEQYEHEIFAVKFYLQEHKSYPDKFNRLTSLNEPSRVITTVGMIMKDLLISNPYASFGFVGSFLKGESKENTKRYRVYSRIMENLMGVVHFEHRQIPKKSAYLLLNRLNQDPDLISKVETMFKYLYDL